MKRATAIVLGGLVLTTYASIPVAIAEATGVTYNASNWPVWVHRPSDVEAVFQAVGIASTREEARQQAQAELLLSISNQSHVEQTSLLGRTQARSLSHFVQRSTSESLLLQLEGVEVREHAEVNGRHAILVSVGVPQVVASLQDALAQISRQSPPEQPTEQLIWALQHYSQVVQGLQIERALQSLNAGESEIRSDLLSLLEQAQTVWSTSGIRIVAPSDTRAFVEVLMHQLPSGGKELLWLQVEQQKQTGKMETGFIEKRSVLLTLRHSQPPFTIIRQHSLQATVAEAKSPQAASSDVEQQLIQRLERPLHSWFL